MKFAVLWTAFFAEVCMRLIHASWLFSALCLLYLPAATAQEGPLTTDPPRGITAEEVIQKFTAKEKEFKNARKLCTYRQSVKFQTLQGTEVNSDYEQVADIRLDDSGKKVKNVVY